MPFFTEGASKWTRAFEIFTVVSTGLDILDTVFDFRMVHQLAQYDDTKGQARWLAVCTTIAVVLELVVKHKMRQKKDNDTAQGYGSFNMDKETQHAQYIMYVGVMELIIFYVEDATTLFIWWVTGVYDATDPLAFANLVTTVISAVLALLVLVYGCVQTVRSVGNGCNADAWAIGFIAALFAGCLIFWAWFALAVIGEGDEYNCIGECAVNDTIYNTTNNSLIFLDGEAEAEEQDGSGFLNSTGDAGLNKAVLGVYVVGWIVAVFGGYFVTGNACCGGFY